MLCNVINGDVAIVLSIIKCDTGKLIIIVSISVRQGELYYFKFSHVTYKYFL